MQYERTQKILMKQISINDSFFILRITDRLEIGQRWLNAGESIFEGSNFS